MKRERKTMCHKSDRRMCACVGVEWVKVHDRNFDDGVVISIAVVVFFVNVVFDCALVGYQRQCKWRTWKWRKWYCKT